MRFSRRSPIVVSLCVGCRQFEVAVQRRHRIEVPARKEDNRVRCDVVLGEWRQLKQIDDVAPFLLRAAYVTVLLWRARLSADAGTLMATLKDHGAPLVTRQPRARGCTWQPTAGSVGARPAAELHTWGANFGALLRAGRVLAAYRTLHRAWTAWNIVRLMAILPAQMPAKECTLASCVTLDVLFLLFATATSSFARVTTWQKCTAYSRTNCILRLRIAAKHRSIVPAPLEVPDDTCAAAHRVAQRGAVENMARGVLYMATAQLDPCLHQTLSTVVLTELQPQ